MKQIIAVLIVLLIVACTLCYCSTDSYIASPYSYGYGGYGVNCYPPVAATYAVAPVTYAAPVYAAPVATTYAVAAPVTYAAPVYSAAAYAYPYSYAAPYAYPYAYGGYGGRPC